MKRLLLVLALVLLIAAPVMAQEEEQPVLSWYSAFFTTYYMNGLYDAGGMTLNRDYYGLDIDLSYYGINYGIEAEIEYFCYRGSNDIYWNYMYGWVNLFGGFVSLSAGNNVYTVYAPVPLAARTVFFNAVYAGTSLGVYDTPYSGAGVNGMALEIFPVSGLAIEAVINIPDASGVAAPEIADTMASMFEIYARFTLKGIGTIYAGLDTDVNNGYDAEAAVMGFYGAFKFTGVKNLAAQVKYAMIVDDGSYIYAGAGYKFPFGLSIYADFNMYLPTVGDSTMDIVAQVRYILDAFAFTVYFDYTNYYGMAFLGEARYDFNGGYLRLRFYYYLDDFSTSYDYRLRFDYVLFF